MAWLMKEFWHRFYSINQKDSETEEDFENKCSEYLKSEQASLPTPLSEDKQEQE